MYSICICLLLCVICFITFEQNSYEKHDNRLIPNLGYYFLNPVFYARYFSREGLTSSARVWPRPRRWPEERETQIRFLTHHRIAPFPINVNNASLPIVCKTHAHRICERKNKQKNNNQIHYIKAIFWIIMNQFQQSLTQKFNLFINIDFFI